MVTADHMAGRARVAAVFGNGKVKVVPSAKVQFKLAAARQQRPEFMVCKAVRAELSALAGLPFLINTRCRSVASSSWGADYKSLLLVYKSLVRSVLLYGASAYGGLYFQCK